MARRVWIAAAAAVCAVMAGCTSSADVAGSDSRESTQPSSAEPTVAFNEQLHDELIAMMRADQGQRSGEAVDETDEDRIARLKEIIDEFGWPTYALVGKQGEDAAWLIAQHADLDPAFQQQALDLLTNAVEEGQASAGNLAYLTDRVAVANGQPQTYGTQIGCRRVGAVPSTPIQNRGGVDARRAEAGLGPLAAYLNKMAKICASDGP